MIAARVWLVVLVGCGRVGFERVPDGATIEGSANVAFVTSSVQDGALGGLAGADAICMQRASEAGLAGTFVAWLSLANSNAFSRIAGARGWRLVDGTPVADDPSDFATNQLLAPLALDEHGTDVRTAGPHPWTGTYGDGTYTGTDCAGWASNATATSGSIGDPKLGSSAFTSAGNLSCDQLHPLYCLEIDRVAHVAFTPPHARLAFVTDETWLPNAGGVSSADATCTAEARIAGLPGTYRAALSTSTTAARDRFDLTRAPWARVDGAVLAATAADLFAGQLGNFPDRTATGSLASALVWGGDPTQPSGPCTGWSSLGGQADLGASWASDGGVFFAGIAGACDQVDHRLLCLQE
jgi:hypothetical protein